MGLVDFCDNFLLTVTCVCMSSMLFHVVIVLLKVGAIKHQ